MNPWNNPEETEEQQLQNGLDAFRGQFCHCGEDADISANGVGFCADHMSAGLAGIEPPKPPNKERKAPPQPSKEINPYYEDYCTSQGRTPEQQMQHDKQQFPGGCMAGFISWISEQRGLFRARHPEQFDHNDNMISPEAWSEWLHEAGTKPPF